MNPWVHRLIGVITSLNLILQPSLPLFENPFESVSYCSQSSANPHFVDEALIPPLFSPIQPLYAHAKAQVTTFLTARLPYLQLLWPYIPYFAQYVQGELNAVHPGLFFAAMLPPKGNKKQSGHSERLEAMMKNVFILVWTQISVDPWSAALEISEPFFAPVLNPADWNLEDLSRARVENEQILMKLREHNDLRSLLVRAMLEIQLVAMRYPSHTQSAQPALDKLKSLNAIKELTKVAQESNDFITVAGALDALKDLQADSSLKELREGRMHQLSERFFTQLRSSPKKSLLSMMSPLMRGKISKSLFVNNADILPLIRDRFKLKNEEDAKIALRIFMGLWVPKRSAQHLIQQLMGIPLDPSDMDYQVMLRMLAIIRYMAAYLPYPANQRLSGVVQQITRKHWRDQYSLAEMMDQGSLVRQVGKMVHEDTHDPAIKDFMGYLFELDYFDSMGMIPSEGPLHRDILDEGYLQAAQTPTRLIEDPRVAAQIELSVLAHLASRFSPRTLPWSKIYRFAANNLKYSSSLSELTGNIIEKFSPGAVDVTTQQKDANGKWAVLVPFSLGPPKNPELGSTYVRYITRAPEESRDAFIQRIKKKFIPKIKVERHFDPTKAHYIRYIWPQIYEFLMDLPLLYPIKTLSVQIDVTQNCILNCLHCRGGDRPVPVVQSSMSREHMEREVVGINKVNPEALVRLSGWIGDANANPNTIWLMRKLNHMNQPWAETTNGLRFTEEELDEMMGAEWIHISWDTSENRSYIIEKMKEPDPEAYIRRLSANFKLPKGVDPLHFVKVGDRGNLWRPASMDGLDGEPSNYLYTKVNNHWLRAIDAAPADVVAWNIQRLVDKKRETGSPVNVFVSVLVQKEYYSKISSLCRRAEAMGVTGLQIKLKHPHPNQSRILSERALEILYDEIIPEITNKYANEHFKIMVVQDEEEANAKNFGTGLVQIAGVPTRSPGPFERCYIEAFNAAVSPIVGRHICCHYEDGIIPTSGSPDQTFDEWWWSKERQERGKVSPQGICRVCPPAELNNNMFFHELKHGAIIFDRGIFDEIGEMLGHVWTEEDFWFAREKKPKFQVIRRSA